MIAFDTNVLVRLLVEDDRSQAAQARAALARCKEREEKCLLTLIVLCELEWVLSSCYRVPKRDIVAAVRALLADEFFLVEETDLVEVALQEFSRGQGDLSDYLLGVRGRRLGARTTFTFDKTLKGAEMFDLL